jgi:dienelactone hydrolase
MNAILEAVPASSAVTTDPRPAGKPSREVDHMQIFGRHVRIDVHEPAVIERSRTILLLHGTGGLLGDGALLRRAARNFAAHDFRACVVHYFNTTGTFFATHSNVSEHAAEWQAAVVAIAHAYALADGRPIGLLGYSLGGFLAVGAAQETPEIGAVAVLGGGLLEEREHLTPAHLPPLLVLHGGKDLRVPVERADALVRMGRRAGVVVESVVYPNEGHTLGASAERDAFERAAEFFAARLEAGAER